MRLIFDLHTRVRILKSSISDLRTRVNIDRAGLRIILSVLDRDKRASSGNKEKEAYVQAEKGALKPYAF